MTWVIFDKANQRNVGIGLMYPLPEYVPTWARESRFPIHGQLKNDIDMSFISFIKQDIIQISLNLKWPNMLTYYRRRTDKTHKIILHFFQRLDSNMDSKVMYELKRKHKNSWTNYS